MSVYQEFGVGIQLHNKDLKDVCLFNTATEAAAISALDAGKGTPPHKGKIVYFDADGGRIMYQGTTAKYILATMSDVGSQTLVGLTDTNIFTESDKQVLIYHGDTSKWVNRTLSGAIIVGNTGVTSYDGVVPLNKGGTNRTTYADGDILYYRTGEDALQTLAKGTNGQFLTLNNGYPDWADIPAQVTLQSELNANLLSIDDQELQLDQQTQKLVFASPIDATGFPSFRKIDAVETQMNTDRMLGRLTASKGDVEEMTAAQVYSFISSEIDTSLSLTFVGDVTGSGAAGSDITLSYENIVPVAKGGTGLDALARGSILYGSGSTPMLVLDEPGTANKYLVYNTSIEVNAPQWATIVATHATMSLNKMLGRISSETNFVEELTSQQVLDFLDSAVFDGKILSISGAVEGSGGFGSGIEVSYNDEVPVEFGGTTLTGYEQGDLLYADTTTSLSRLEKDTSDNRYLSNAGDNNNPMWQQIDWAHIANTPSDYQPEAHALLGDKHTVSGLSIGHFLKATGEASFGFAAHGLETDDIPEPAPESNPTNLWFTEVRVQDTILSKYTTQTSPGAWQQLAPEHDVVTAFERVQAQLLWLDQKITLGTAPLEPADALFDDSDSFPATSGEIDDVTIFNGMRVLLRNASANTHMVISFDGSSWSVADEPEANTTIWIADGSAFGGTTWQYDATEGNEKWVQIGGATGLQEGHLISIVGTTIGIADASAYRVLANATGSTAAPQWIGAAGTNEVFRRPGSGNLAWGTIGGDYFANQSNNTIFASPANGSSGKPLFRAMAVNDLPLDIPWSNLSTGSVNHVVITDSKGELDTMANLNVARGGTGRGTLTQYALLLGNGTSQVNFVNPKAANYWLRSAGTTNNPDWSSWMLPSTVAQGDVGKFLYGSGANTTAWKFLEVSDLPATTTRTYVQLLSAAGNDVSIMRGTHGFNGEHDRIVHVELWNKEGTEFRMYHVDYTVDMPTWSPSPIPANWNRVTAKTSGSDWNWAAGSYLVITGVTTTK